MLHNRGRKASHGGFTAGFVPEVTVLFHRHASIRSSLLNSFSVYYYKAIAHEYIVVNDTAHKV